jgi:hypothetical protein
VTPENDCVRLSLSRGSIYFEVELQTNGLLSVMLLLPIRTPTFRMESTTH